MLTAYGSAPDSRTTSFTYDSYNRIIGAETPEGYLHYEYDPETGLKTRTWTDTGTETCYGYDTLNRLSTVASVDPADGTTNLTTYTYTAVGSRETVTLPNGVSTHYGYDTLNRLTSIAHFGESGELLGFYDYTLAADGRRTQAYEILRNPGSETFSTNLVTYTYDNLNRLTYEVMEIPGVGVAYESEYTYDLAGNRLFRRVWVGGQILTTSYTYDDNDRLIREENAVEVAALTYAPSGALLAGYGGSDLVNAKPVLAQIATKTAGLATRALPGVWTRWVFRGIPVFMLLAFLLPIAIGAFNTRRLRARRAQQMTCYRLPLFMRGTASLMAATMLLTSLPYKTLAQESDLYTQLESSNWGRAGTVTQYAYDDNGSLISKTRTGGGETSVDQYAYDLQNRMVGHVWTTDDGVDEAVTTTAFRYNHEGVRVGKDTTVTINGVVNDDMAEEINYLIDFNNPTGYAQIIEELDGEGALIKSYTIGDDVLSQSTRLGYSSIFENSYLLYDGHGSTRQLSDSLGAVTAQYTYDSYGVMLGQTADVQASQATSLLYSGEQFDTTLQQYYLRARYYNQANGQFSSLDPYSGNKHDPQSLHKYAYCHADPVNGIDPSGKASFLLSGTMITSVIIGTIGGIVTGTMFGNMYGSKAKWKYILLFGGLGFLSGLAMGCVAVLSATLAAAGMAAFWVIGIAFLLNVTVYFIINYLAFWVSNGVPPIEDELLSLLKISVVPALIIALGIISFPITVVTTLIGIILDLLIIPAFAKATEVSKDGGPVGQLKRALVILREGGADV